MNPLGWKALACSLLALLLAAPAWALRAVAPGTLNYAEGEAKLEDQPLDKDSIGSVDLRPGQVLNTGTEGKTEVLLGPGQIFRLGDNSSARMISDKPPELELTKGQATVQLLPNRTGPVLVREAGATARLQKAGLYFFDADRARVLVDKGEAEVQAGNQTLKVKSGRAVELNQSGNLKTAKFDKKEFERNDLVQFSGLRAEYLAEANANAANAYYLNSAGWYGPGWYWSPAFWTYTWVPGGDAFCDPFGWCYYSPFWVVDDPFLFAGFFGDFGIGCFGHTHFGRHRLPDSFSARTGQGGAAGAQPPAMTHNLGTTGTGTAGTGATGTAFNHPAAFNRGGAMGGGFHGGGFAGGGHAASGGHAGASSGSFGGGGFSGGGFSGGFGGGHR